MKGPRFKKGSEVVHVLSGTKGVVLFVYHNIASGWLYVVTYSPNEIIFNRPVASTVFEKDLACYHCNFCNS